MKKIFILTIFFISFSVVSSVKPEQCIPVKNHVGIATLFTMVEDFDIPIAQVDRSKTKTEILYTEPVNHELAMLYGKKERILSGGEMSDDKTTAEQYAEGFMRNNAKNIIVKYNFYNHQGKENILIISAFVSDTDCAVRWNGYVVVKREF
ncbi:MULTISPECIES: hypothetical protein [Pantoea]|jgi:hypothetical protein|uniref:Shiga toxin A subunit n=1 Tax=Pantoea piersonii TaxID=2364647 RepID=A0AAJ5QJ51_9GAMM|nr:MULTISPECIES: hypothetical protein [Pantoea]MBZ6384790.1 hypothetical protein [Pantoea piersonii]MBZ6402302.1 hypothetical protein [Pantoea piersonii]MBZ6408846.1 hypothetical protein [Pantoea piersonii]MBZ6425974.1 hypothetical protein [Pantoea piersonii]NYB03057.1 hypothetical protein [Pantoea piersonii]